MLAQPWSRLLAPTSSALCSVYHSRTMSDKPVMAIRRETINVWERRAPLSPVQVRKLVKKGIKVILQPSDRRAYSMKVSWVVLSNV